MNFDFSDDQKQLRDEARKYLAEKCSPKVFIPGRQREPGDCKTENYVTRAVCQ